MKKNYSKLLLLLIALISSSFIFAQTNRVKITVNWPADAHENKVEVYDPASNLILTICNNNGPNDCFQSSGSEVFTATYDLGCLKVDPVAGNYSVKLFDLSGGWSSGSSLTVEVEGIADQNINVSSASSSGGPDQIFNVNSNTLCSFEDTDEDGVIDLIDVDDDNDGILDTAEGLDLNQFNCQVPSLIFLNGFYDSSVSTGSEGNLGAVYRFQNASENIDVLLQIVELTNCTIDDIDDDSVDTAEFLQSRLNFTGSNTPGVTYEFSLVNEGGDLNDLAEIQRIGGTTWDCDGTDEYQESVRYYYPSAYGLDNPTSLTQDIYEEADYPGEAGAGITAGTETYAGFSTNTILRSYFQFLANKFRIRMQLKKTTSTARTRLYAMSFTQCDIFEYKATTLTIVSGKDTDEDGINNELDIDSDNDGIPDNVEAQLTIGYIAPNETLDGDADVDGNGLNTAYPGGISIVDTDADDIPDFIDSDSDNDGTADIDESGIDYTPANLGTDTDQDGLDDEFEGTEVNDPLDVNDEIEVPKDDLQDSDGDVNEVNGDVDYRDATTFGASQIDFDGIDDYLDSAQILSGYSNATIMAWIKLKDEIDGDGDMFNSDGFVIGQDNFNLFVNASGNITARVNGTSYQDSSFDSIDLNKWVHIAAVYQGGNLVIYINGVRGDNEFNTGTVLNSSGEKFTIGKNSTTNSEFFKGSMDEVRVFSVGLTQKQIRQMVFQEIEEAGSFVQGTVVPKVINGFSVGNEIQWLNLQAYYDMNVITGGKTIDASVNGYDATLYNINSIQEQTSPIPYETKADGAWGDTNIWKNGDVWDIQDPSVVKDWAIFRINEDHEVYHNNSIKSYGLLIENNAKLTVGLVDQEFQDFQVQNGWYLKLDGTIDLQDDSQLVQTENSELVIGSSGKLLRRQEGNLNYYWYNYWSSPVAGNDADTSYKLKNIKDEGGESGFSFTPEYQAEGQISRFWLYTYQNGQTYYDWEQITEETVIEPGVGYTQKGTNATSDPNAERNYTFVGKPNNGTILLLADDVEDNASNEHSNVPGAYNYTSSLVGNPYPSALDGHEFIRDNEGVIEGTIYLWEQWFGENHNLAEYQGGYGTINLAGQEKAYQWNDPNPDPEADPLAKEPSQYIPVAQGFFVEVVEDGEIEFNNSQRIFKKEAEDGGPVFFRTSNIEDPSSAEENAMGMIRLKLEVSNGNKRSFVLAFSDSTTDGYDYGYDSRTIDPQDDDMNSILSGEKMIIQSYSPIANNKVIDLVFNSTGTYNYSLDIIEINNILEDQPIFIKDNLTNTEFDLRTGAYNFTSDFNGEDTDRFDIVFKATTLGLDDFSADNTLIYVNNIEHKLYVKGLQSQAKQLNITNILGQNIRSLNNVSTLTLDNGLDISNLSSGVYIISVSNDENQTIDKKVIIE